MNSYYVIHSFRDKWDGNHHYKNGDKYPRAGCKPASERVSELASALNAAHRPLIAEVENKLPEAVKETAEELSEAPKKASTKRTQKK